MAHLSYPSPDGKWVLLVEMDSDHLWLPCRVVPMDGSSAASGRARWWRLHGRRMVARWQLDVFHRQSRGSQSYLAAAFPRWPAKQITSGPTEEDGIAVAPDGRSFVTAVALQNTSLWLHTPRATGRFHWKATALTPFHARWQEAVLPHVREAPNRFTFYRDPGNYA